MKIKNIFKDKLFLGAIIHAAITWGMLSLAYNSYKEFRRGLGVIYLVTAEQKIAIKSTFLWGVLVFVTLYVLFGIVRGKKEGYPGVKQYAIIIAIYVLSLNLLFITRGAGVLIVLNISWVYLAAVLFAWSGIKRSSIAGWFNAIIVPFVYRAFNGYIPVLKQYLRDKPADPFIVGFMALLALCAVLFIFNYEKAAEGLANIAYLFLGVAVAVEAYLMIRRGERDAN